MKHKILPNHLIAVAALVSIFLVSCAKNIDQPTMFGAREIDGFRISESRLVLLQDNAKNQAVVFNWATGNPNDTYVLEADVSADYFSDPTELISTTANSVSFTTQDFNDLMNKLVFAGKATKVDFRIKVQRGLNVVYSGPTAMFVTTYSNYVLYDESNTLKVPGNFQGWNVATAPKIVSAKEKGEYEGFMNFANPSPQILLVKGNQWDMKYIFTDIGNDMFGYGGSIMPVNGGPGVYLVRASTNTNRWSSTKITGWSIAGDAVKANAQARMNAEDETLSWSITTDLVKGGFRIRANNSNAVSFGHSESDQPGVPSYDGDDLVIKKNGNYTITLSLSVAGNYSYSISRNS